ncbi:MAG TPA: efflux RND transporter periplasmic adaptor subunit [Verrucomicrobiota bacterium]|nr:efflux RND transporter periplasmic adaptor subunit [Verrucomicrobiota bacterium]
MKKRIFISILIVLAVFAVLAGIKVLQISTLIASSKSQEMPPETVSSAVAREEKWPDTLNTIGTITAVQGVTITPEIAGTVREIAFESGAIASAGDLLVRLDTSSEEAQLRAAEAQVELAALNAERARKLHGQNTVSQAELDAAEAALKQLQADADTIRAVIAKKTLRAPFTGRLGIRQVNLGQYVDKDNPIVSLQSLAPVYCDFRLPQQALARLKTGLTVRLRSDTYPDTLFEGKLTAINPDLDSSTRSVLLQATFDNRDHLLRPGMFNRVEVVLPEQTTVLTIPSTSVLSSPYGDSVYVIESKTPEGGGAEQLVLRQQFIRTGAARGDFVSVEAGLKPGERVVNSGLFKLRNGMTVVENNDIKAPATQTPSPSDS